LVAARKPELCALATAILMRPFAVLANRNPTISLKTTLWDTNPGSQYRS
jgi:hypothetical protein